MTNMWILWLILTIVFAVIEALTLGLTTVWCAIGSAVAMVMDLCGAPVAAQLTVMVVVSIICFVVCMIWIKPKLDERHRVNVEPTNADRVLGKEGLVTVTINPIEGKGQVKVIGQTWSAKSDRQIEEGKKIRVTGMEGVKLIVEEIV